jgi:hypothetical protein
LGGTAPAAMFALVYKEGVCVAGERPFAAHAVGTIRGGVGAEVARLLRPVTATPAAAAQPAADDLASAFALGDALHRAARPTKAKNWSRLVKATPCDFQRAVGLRTATAGPSNKDVTPFIRLKVIAKVLQLLAVKLAAHMASVLRTETDLPFPCSLGDVVRGSIAPAVSTADYAAFIATIAARAAGLSSLIGRYEATQADAGKNRTATHVRVDPGSRVFEDWVSHVRRVDVEASAVFLQDLTNSATVITRALRPVTMRGDTPAAVGLTLAGFGFEADALEDLPALWVAVAAADGVRRVALAASMAEDVSDWKARCKKEDEDARVARQTEALAAAREKKVPAATGGRGAGAPTTPSPGGGRGSGAVAVATGGRGGRGGGAAATRSSTLNAADSDFKDKTMALCPAARPDWALRKLGLCTKCRDIGHLRATCPATALVAFDANAT